ncbi:hypothetical protein [Vibrio phage vB_pir03]|nr:hypothetical protein [Vibrio phage vB_pir03]
MAIDVHIPLGVVSNAPEDRFNSSVTIKSIAGSKREADARRLRFFAGTPCKNNHFIRDLITNTKQPFSIRYRRSGKCAICEFHRKLDRGYHKKRTAIGTKPSYADYKDKHHR